MTIETYNVWIVPEWVWLILLFIGSIGPLLLLYRHCRKTRSLSLPLALLAMIVASVFLGLNHFYLIWQILGKLSAFIIVYFGVQWLERKRQKYQAYSEM